MKPDDFFSEFWHHSRDAEVAEMIVRDLKEILEEDDPAFETVLAALSRSLEDMESKKYEAMCTRLTTILKNFGLPTERAPCKRCFVYLGSHEQFKYQVDFRSSRDFFRKLSGLIYKPVNESDVTTEPAPGCPKGSVRLSVSGYPHKILVIPDT